MSGSSLLKTIKGLIFAAVALTPVFYWKWSIYPFGLPRTVFFQILVELILAIWLALAVKNRDFRPKLTPVTIAILVLLAALLLTSATGVDFWRSFWSSEERSAGVFAIAHAAALALVIMSLGRELDWRKLFSASVYASAFISALAFVQLAVPNLLAEENPGTRPGSTFGNPSFLAAYLIFNVFLAGYLAWSESRRSKGAAGVYGALGVINIIAIITSQTRGAFLGLLAGIVLLFLYFLWTSSGRRRNALIAVAIWAAIFGGAFLATHSASFWNRVPLLNRFQDFSAGDIGFMPRLAALRAAWQGFKERPLLGWGPENFNIAFNKFYDPRTLELGYTETRFDKPHNFLAEYAVTGGMALLLAYLWFAFVLLRGLYRIFLSGGEEDRMGALFLGAALAAYWVQNLFVFDTVGSYLMLFLAVAWIGARSEPGQSVLPSAEPASPLLLSGSLVAVLVLIYFVNVRAGLAGIYQYDGFMTLAKNPKQGIEYFRAAADTWSPYAWAAKRDFAMAVTEAYFQNPGRIPEDAVLEGLSEMEKVAREHPLDAYNHYSLVDLYNQASDIDPGTLLAKAEKEAKIALELSPGRQEVYFSLAKTKSLQGDNAGALAELQRAIDLNPRIPDAHFYYGLIAYSDGKPDLGYAEIKKAEELGRLWRNADEARVTANYFADSGHLSEAIDLYRTALNLDPKDVESEIKLGIAYFMTGDREAAKTYITRAIEAGDITRSPAYPELQPILRDLGLAQ